MSEIYQYGIAIFIVAMIFFSVKIGSKNPQNKLRLQLMVLSVVLFTGGYFLNDLIQDYSPQKLIIFIICLSGVFLRQFKTIWEKL